MIWAEEKISKDGAPIAHRHILIQQGRLGNRVDENLEEDRGKLLLVNNSIKNKRQIIM